MKKQVERTEHVSTKYTESNGTTYVYKKTLGQKIGRGLLTLVVCIIAGMVAIQIVNAVLNLF